ncbi:sulfite exporter TauE/SafE family protein [Zobellella denitrificans]|jgi:uncharacterized protein|nr:sulfite exporter TauE/SafE family protein [Zobellella denitrificans]
MMITDPYFYLVAVPAVLIYGIGKGGLGGALGVVAVPLISLTTHPSTAAAVLLPLLCLMDLFAVAWHHRHVCWRQIRQIIPGALLGVALAGLLMARAPTWLLTGFIGIASILFCLHHWFSPPVPARAGGLGQGTLWGTLTGLFSTTIHAGGAPASMYLLPQQLEKRLLVGTMAVLFALINLMKLVPYALLGQLNPGNLQTALMLVPLVPVGVWLGVWLVRTASQRLIYRLCYGLLFLSGLHFLQLSLRSWW